MWNLTQILISKTFVRRKLIVSFLLAERARLNAEGQRNYLKEISRERRKGGKIIKE